MVKTPRKQSVFVEAGKKTWNGVSKEERSKRMKALVEKRWKKTSKKKRVEFAKRIRNAKKK